MNQNTNIKKCMCYFTCNYYPWHNTIPSWTTDSSCTIFLSFLSPGVSSSLQPMYSYWWYGAQNLKYVICDSAVKRHTAHDKHTHIIYTHIYFSTYNGEINNQYTCKIYNLLKFPNFINHILIKDIVLGHIS